MEAKITSGAAVHLKGICKQYGSFTALDNVSLDIPSGSFCTFLGPSGSGKTTTLNIVGGLVHPDRGAVFIGDEDATHLSADKRGLGFVFQSYALFPHMTVAQNIAYPLKLRRIAVEEKRKRVEEALELVRLANIADRYPSQLSGGQQQRVALARAFVFGPKVLLMDEPLSALDAGSRAHLQREIVRITRELGCTVLYVTHDQEEALAMSDQIVLFNSGGIVQSGSPFDIYSNPLSEFTASFVGNGKLVRGIVQRNQTQWFVKTPNGFDIPIDADSVKHCGLREGNGAAAVFRPETATLHPLPSPASGDENLFLVCQGTVTDAIFAGGQMKILVGIDDGIEIECRCPLSQKYWRQGEQVTVHVDMNALPAVVPIQHP